MNENNILEKIIRELISRRRKRRDTQIIKEKQTEFKLNHSKTISDSYNQQTKKLNNSGRDTISNKLINRTKESLSKELTKLFNKIL